MMVQTSDRLTLKELKKYKQNPRQNLSKTISDLKAGIIKFGFVVPILVRKKDKLIIGGHQRLEALMHLEKDGFNVPHVPVVYWDGTDEEAAALNISLNQIQDEWDYKKLSEMFGGLSDTLRKYTGFSELDIKAIKESASLDGEDHDLFRKKLDDATRDSFVDSEGGDGPKRTDIADWKNFTVRAKERVHVMAMSEIDRIKAHYGCDDSTALEKMVTNSAGVRLK